MEIFDRKFILLPLFLLIITSFVSTQNTTTVIINNAEIEQAVFDALNMTESVPIIVEIISKNASLIDFVLSNLSSSEFKLNNVLTGNYGFYGNITREGLNKLINNPNVKTIYLNKEWHILENGTINKNKTDLKNKINFDNQDMIIFALILLIIIFYIIFKKKRW